MASWVTMDIGDSESPSSEGNKGAFSTLLDSIKSKLVIGAVVNETLQSKSYKWFLITLFTGLALLFFSLLFLPLVVIYPQKFCVLFSLGSLIITISFAFLQSPIEYVKSLFAGKNAIFSGCYIAALLFSLYAALIKQKYFMTLVATGCQLAALIYLIASRFPNGMHIVGMLNSCIGSLCSSIFGRCFT